MLLLFDRCEIDWCKGQNVTVKTIKKKQKHKGRGTTRTITKTVQNDSFFNFFTPPTGKNILMYINSLQVLSFTGAYVLQLKRMVQKLISKHLIFSKTIFDS